MDVRYMDFFDAAAVADETQILANRLDAAAVSIVGSEAEPKRVTGFMGRCANSGYLVFLRNGQVISTIDLAVMNALTEFSPLECDLGAGDRLAVHEMSTTGTALCSCTMRYEVG